LTPLSPSVLFCVCVCVCVARGWNSKKFSPVPWGKGTYFTWLMSWILNEEIQRSKKLLVLVDSNIYTVLCAPVFISFASERTTYSHTSSSFSRSVLIFYFRIKAILSLKILKGASLSAWAPFVFKRLPDSFDFTTRREAGHNEMS
jgi:hypothetical protein